MAVKQTHYFASCNSFTASEQVQFLPTLQRIWFSDELVLAGAQEQEQEGLLTSSMPTLSKASLNILEAGIGLI